MLIKSTYVHMIEPGVLKGGKWCCGALMCYLQPNMGEKRSLMSTSDSFWVGNIFTKYEFLLIFKLLEIGPC